MSKNIDSVLPDKDEEQLIQVRIERDLVTRVHKKLDREKKLGKKATLKNLVSGFFKRYVKEQ